MKRSNPFIYIKHYLGLGVISDHLCENRLHHMLSFKRTDYPTLKHWGVRRYEVYRASMARTEEAVKYASRVPHTNFNSYCASWGSRTQLDG